MATTLEKKLLAADLARDGFVIKDLGNWPLTATYYKANGEALPKLPADPYSMQKYMRRGFTLVPPAVKAETGSLTCESCGFEAKSAFGLQSHNRKHEKAGGN